MQLCKCMLHFYFTLLYPSCFLKQLYMLQVPDCETPEFWAHMDKLVALNQKLAKIGSSDSPAWMKNLQKIPVFQQFAGELSALYFGKSIQAGTFDAQKEAQLVY